MNSSRILSAVRQAPSCACLLGFDGFCDAIYRAVDSRGAEIVTWIPSLSAFAERVAAAAGRSGNVELVLQRRKLGGNAPIMAQAMASLGHRVFLAGTVGEGTPEPLFAGLEELCEDVVSLGKPGQSDALEFEDGKLILGKLDSLHEIGVESLLQAASQQQWLQRVEESALCAAVNWTMLPKMTEIWRYFARELGPRLSHRPYFFVDLADPAKRSDDDLAEGLAQLTELQASFEVLLGLNLAEAARLSQLFGHATPTENPRSVERAARALREQLGLAQVAVHPIACAALATREGSCYVRGKRIDQPLLSTGGGDNFNAGYCHGLLCHLHPEEALHCAVSCSGFYVSHGRSPGPAELEEALRASSLSGL